jgi:glycogen debranching enzyme
MKILRVLVAALLFTAAAVNGSTATEQPASSAPTLELTRPARPWEFVSAVGTQAGIFGNESGRIEAWVYPLKIFRDFHLRFHTEDRVLPAETLARTVIVRPESTTILYTSDTFSVRETFFAPVNEPGAVVSFEVETEFPLEIEAVFHRDFQLEWPAALGATYVNWEPQRSAFYFGEESKTFSAFLGSPTAHEAHTEFATNYSSDAECSFRLGLITKGKATRTIVLAASVHGRPDAEAAYEHLAADYQKLLNESADYYRNYLSRTVSVDLPDDQLQRAYDWSRISMIQGMVTNPYLGTGLVAGYRTSGESQRPGFAWFFGRDSMWTALALDAEGDFAATRKALEFISKYQREDGKIPHEIAQGANFVPWFKDYPYAYASADATPLYIIAMHDYVAGSGDTAFAQAKWDSIWKAYQFLLSTYDAQGFPQNFGFGHGWVEGGPLLPVKSELYQSGLGAEALLALSNLARLAGKDKESKELSSAFEKQKPLVNNAFWIADKKRFAFALDKDGKTVDEASVLSTVPMWFGLLEEEKAGEMIAQLSDANHQADWGMRIISGEAARYSGGGYHYGSVWPLFTGWASVGEYRYHHEHAAYANLRANALLALDGSPGHVTEVLSGDYYQGLSTSSPHQIWSAAMVVSPILRGMFGLAVDMEKHSVTLEPHLPADWNSFALRNVHVGAATLDFEYTRTPDSIELHINRDGGSNVPIAFNPALSPRATVFSVEMNGRKIPFQIDKHATDQHLIVGASADQQSTTIKISLRDDVGVSYHAELPQLGSPSEGLRILSEDWSSSQDELALDISGMPGRAYELFVGNSSELVSVDGAELMRADDGSAHLHVLIPVEEGLNRVRATVRLHFAAKTKPRKR